MIEWLKENNYIKKEIKIDNNCYDVYLKEKVYSLKTVPGIVVVSYQPNKQSSELLKLCIESIKKFTDTDYELWIVDNNSPGDYIKWINDIKDINVAYVRTEPKGEASYANGLALEVAAKLISPDTRYLVCFHEDIVVCRYGWLNYMLSKMDKKIKAAGFRLTKARVPEGVLHICGYMIDFQIFKELKLSFLPELPRFDVGDKAIYLLRKNGFGIFHTPNTFDNPELTGLIPPTMEIYNLNVTRSFNDKNEVIYMHLGRGIPKARGEYRNKEKSSSEQWSEYIRSNLFSEPLIQFIEPGTINGFDFSVISIRDFYVLNFIINNLDLLSDKSDVFYYGEKNNNLFKKKLNINYLTGLPAGNKKFDCVVFPEVNEHAGITGDIVEWSWKNLNSGGILLITIPFILNSEGGQSADSKNSYKLTTDKLWKAGFREVSVTEQGMWNILELQKELEKLKLKTRELDKDKARVIINRSIIRKLKKILKAENRLKANKISKATNVTTGYGIKAVK